VSSVSETIVREYFELHGILVRQQRKYVAHTKREDDQVDFFICNPQAVETKAPLPFILGSSDLARIQRGVVVVKGWHTETFSPAVLANAPEIFRFVESAVFQQAAKIFGGDGAITKILVVPALPTGDEARQQSIELLKSKGVDAAIPFRTILNDLIEFTQTNRNYQKSDLLQVIRILKNYDFFREPQLELFKPTRRRKRPPAQDRP
jgi:hypothetical protein